MQMRPITAAVSFIVLCVAPVMGQYQIQQDGRLFDANPELNSGGVNYVRPNIRFLGGNQFLSGNVRRGLSFQGTRTIPDSLSFRAPLGSASLSDFRRDSLSVADRNLSRLGFGVTGGIGAAAVEPSHVAPTAGFLRGYFDGGGLSQLGVTGPQPSRVTPFTAGGSLDLRIDPRNVLRSGQPNFAPTELGVRPFTIDGPIRPAFNQQQDAAEAFFRIPGSPQRDAARPGFRESTSPDRSSEQSPLARRDPLDLRVGNRFESADPQRATPRVEPEFTPSVTDAALLDRGLARLGDGDAADIARPSLGVTMPSPTRIDEDPTINVALQRVNVSALPGYDTFGDLQLALELERDPQAEWFGEMRRAAQGRPDAADQSFAGDDLDVDAFKQRLLAEPVGSFVGKGRSQLNDELLKAEGLMEVGDFYAAADRYNIATRLDPANPLPRLGRAHALLAAGEYNSAASALLEAVELFPEVLRMPVNLERLLGGGEIVDIRRADLQDRLRTRDDARVRFLLGYLELRGGRPERGMQTLQAAADAAPAGSVISRAPQIIRSGG